MPQLKTRSLCRSLSAAIIAASLVVAPVAHAEPTAAEVETALALYKDGKALREKGELQPALEKLKAAYALVATPITALELGKTYVAMGKLVEAREVLLTVPRIPVRPNESTKAAEARTESEALAAQIKPRLATITVRLKGTVPAGVTSKLSVDGVLVPPDAATVPRVLNPGAHVVVLEAGGQRAQSDVTVAEGESKDVEVVVPEGLTAPPVVPVVPVTPQQGDQGAAPPARAGGMSPLVPIGFVTAGVGVAVGLVTGIMTLSTAGTVKDTCSKDGRCPAKAQSDIDSAKTTGTVSTVAFVIGAAGAIVGVVGILTSKPATETPRATGLRIVPTPAGVAGTF